MPSPTSPNLDNPGPREVIDPHDTSAAAGASVRGKRKKRREPNVFQQLQSDAILAGIANARFSDFEMPKSDAWRGTGSPPDISVPVWTRNEMMEHPIISSRGYRGSSALYTLLADPLEKFMPLRPGMLHCPTEWQPLSMKEKP